MKKSAQYSGGERVRADLEVERRPRQIWQKRERTQDGKEQEYCRIMDLAAQAVGRGSGMAFSVEGKTWSRVP